MSKPLIVSIPHNLGKDEARRRLQGGLGELHGQFDGKLSHIEDTWTGDHLDFRVAVLGQSLTGGIDVLDESVRLEVQLPWVLSFVAEKAKSLIQKQGTLMLEKK
jgi:hypothetical protein